MDLPKHPVVHGHPMHAILSDGPVVLIPVAIAAELWERNGTAEGLRLGDVATVGAFVTTLAAGLVGWIDWLTVPSDHPVRRPATIHGLINTTALVALVGAVPAGRRRLKLLAAAEMAILVGAWIGGDLVFRHGWRVRPAEEAEIVEERLGDAGVAAFEEARRDVDDFERQKTFLPSS
jgi:hypothetical protein